MPGEITQSSNSKILNLEASSSISKTRTSRKINAIGKYDAGRISRDTISQHDYVRVVDVEISDNGEILASVDNLGCLLVWSTSTNSLRFSARIDLSPIYEWVDSEKPKIRWIYDRYYYSFKRRLCYPNEDYLEKLLNKARRGKSLLAQELKELHYLVASQAVRISISRNAEYIFVFEGHHVYKYSVSQGVLLNKASLAYVDIAVDNLACVAYAARPGGIYCVNLETCQIDRRLSLTEYSNLSPLFSSIRLDNSSRYLTAHLYEFDIRKMPFGSLYNGESFLTEFELGQILGLKGGNAMGKLGYTLANFRNAYRNVFPSVRRAIGSEYIITWDIAELVEIAKNKILTNLNDYRATPVYSSLFDAHYFMDGSRKVVACLSPASASSDYYSYSIPSVNFEINVVDDRLVILDNNKTSGSDVINIFSQDGSGWNVSYDMECDIYTNVRVNDVSRSIVVGCSDGSIRLIDLETSAQSVTSTPHEKGVQLLSSLTDSGFFVSAGSDRTISVWRIS